MNTNNKKYAFCTLGCRANQYQTEVIKSQVVSRKSQVVNFNAEADVYVINTCTVTEDADRKSRQAIRKALRQNPKAKIMVTGCYAKLNHAELKKQFPQIILTPSLVPIPSGLRVSPSPSLMERGIKGVRVRTNLMIQDGCEHFCSYCIVPYARGKITRKPFNQVIQEAKNLVEAGAREIILTGINLGTYGSGALCSVLSALSSIPPLFRIRLSSIEPMYLTKELIQAMAETPKVCHHLHIPLQSGDDSILQSMNRNYTRDGFCDLVSYIREKIPDCGLTTDIIVGFPGEGKKEFQNTVDLVKQIKFSRLHIFPYSKREGTKAADFPNQVDVKTKKQRSKTLLELGKDLMIDFARQYLNKKIEILAEQKGEGLTSNFIRCFFNDPVDSSGKLKKISVKSVTASGEIRG